MGRVNFGGIRDWRQAKAGKNKNNKPPSHFLIILFHGLRFIWSNI
jgi:hypothetical protein